MNIGTMKRIPYLILVLMFFTALFTSCGEDRTHEYYELTEENQWTFSKMKEVYLWRDNIKSPSRSTFFSKPSKFFSSILYNGDKVSYFTDTVSAGDYGMTFAVMRDPLGERPSKVYALVLMVEPDSPADIAGVKRGTWISSVGGTAFTTTKFSMLQSGGNTELVTELIEYDDDENKYYWTPGDTLQIAQSVDYTEQSIYLDSIYTISSKNIGYIVINNFNGEDFVNDTQDRLLRFTANDVSDVVIDLRYCTGGSVANALSLASSFVAPELYGTTFCNLVDAAGETDTTYCYTRQSTSLFEKQLYIITGEQTSGAAELFISALENSCLYNDLITLGARTANVNTMTTCFKSPFGFEINPATNYVALASGELLTGITPTASVNELQQITDIQQLGSSQEYLLYNIFLLADNGAISTDAISAQKTVFRRNNKPIIK